MEMQALSYTMVASLIETTSTLQRPIFKNISSNSALLPLEIYPIDTCTYV